MQAFRGALFTRIVPIVKDIGLWGETIRNGYTEMGIIQMADVDVEALQESDQDIAKQFDARQSLRGKRRRPRAGDGARLTPSKARR